MTTLYLDTEFNGFGGPLISIALVGPQGEQFYEAQELLCQIDPWVWQNVYPVLDKSDDEILLPMELRAEFHKWIVQFKSPMVVCDWHADAAHFASLLAGVDYGSSLDFPCTLAILKTPPGQPVSKRQHNALADARALMEWHQSLRQAA